MRSEPTRPNLGFRAAFGPAPAFEFSPDDDGFIVACKADNVSHQAIADTLGCTKGTLESRIAALRRVGVLPPGPERRVRVVSIEPPADGAENAPAPKRRRATNPLGGKVGGFCVPAVEPMPTFRADPLVPLALADGAPVTMANVKDGMCRWPRGEVRDPDFRLCGHPASAGRPYCAHHCRRASGGRAQPLAQADLSEMRRALARRGARC